MKTLLLGSLVLCFWSGVALAEGLECSLTGDHGDYAPHTKVEADLNGDGIKDVFYLAGSEEVFQTCIFLGAKTKTGVTYELAHSHSDFYDTVFNFDGSKTPQILVPSTLDAECDEMSELIPESLKAEIKSSYEKWAKGYEAYNFTYNMPEFFPISNLFLRNDVRIYRFEKNKKVDVTKKMKPYLKLKTKVLEATLKQKDVSKSCRKKLETKLKAVRTK